MGAPGEALHVLGDDTRRAIVELLAHGPRSVGELARHLPVSRPAVSQHLGTLKRAGLVVDRAIGTRRIYRLDPAGLGLLRTYLDRMWVAALDGFAEAAELAGDDHADDVVGEPRGEPRGEHDDDRDDHDDEGKHPR